jgi:cysteine sulfinate desulfinase/cysteine desulfurase-like protein
MSTPHKLHDRKNNGRNSSRRPPTIFPPHTPLYFDYNATTPVDTVVSSTMMPYITSMWGNPSSSHYYGKGPKQAVELARRQVAKAINAEPINTITFTSGGTESANWYVIIMFAFFLKK